MNNRYRYIFLILTLFPLCAQAGYYRWVDKKGVVHYSSSVPPSYSQQGHTELSKNGMTKKKVLSSKKNREQKLLEIKLAKQRKSDEEKLKLKRIEEAEDSRLLYIFNNEDELSESYNVKIRLAQITIDLLKSRHKVQSDKLGVLETRLEHTKLEKQKTALEEKINDVLDNLKVYQQAITENQIEKSKVQKNFDETLKRFQRLTTASKEKDAKVSQ